MCVFVLAIQSLLDLNTFYDLCYVNVFLLIIHLSSYPSPRGLAFTWWGCYGLCPRHKPTELAHSFYFVLVYVSVFMALSTIFHSINSPDNSPLFLLCSSGLTSALLVLSTIYLCIKVSFNPDII